MTLFKNLKMKSPEQLSQDPIFNMGLSLMANSGPSLTPVNPLAGLQSTFGAMHERQRQRRMDNHGMKMDNLGMDLRQGQFDLNKQKHQYAMGLADKKSQQRNKTMDYLNAKHPELAEKVEAGFLPIGEAWKQVNGPDYKPTTLERNAQAAGFEAGTPEYQDFIRQNMLKPQTSVTIDQGENAYNKELAKGSAQMFNKLSEQYGTTQLALGQLERAEALLSQFESGGVAKFKHMAGEMGIDSEGLDDIQAFQAIVNKLVPTLRVPGSGPMSDADLLLFKQSMPRIRNQPGGNQLIIDALRGVYQYQIEQGKIAQLAQMGKLSREEAVAALNDLENPLEELNTAMSAQGVDRQTLLHKKYGLE